jgi:hypothetical protein
MTSRQLSELQVAVNDLAAVPLHRGLGNSAVDGHSKALHAVVVRVDEVQRVSARTNDPVLVRVAAGPIGVVLPGV